jgi:hypothetical protein
MHTTREQRPRRSAGDKWASFASGLSAWLGGVAFSVGVGHWAPTWVAAALTVPSVALAAGTSAALARRRRVA